MQYGLLLSISKIIFQFFLYNRKEERSTLLFIGLSNLKLGSLDQKKVTKFSIFMFSFLAHLKQYLFILVI